MAAEREFLEEVIIMAAVKRATGEREEIPLRAFLYSDNTARFPDLNEILGEGDQISVPL